MPPDPKSKIFKSFNELSLPTGEGAESPAVHTPIRPATQESPRPKAPLVEKSPKASRKPPPRPQRPAFDINHFRQLTEQAQRAIRSRNYEEALKNLNQAMEMGVEALRRVHRDSPAEAPAQNREREAVNIPSRILPLMISTLYQRGGVKLQCRDAEGAAQDYATVLKYAPDHMPAMKALARLRMEAGDHAGSLELLESIKKIRPDDFQVLYRTGECLRLLGRGEEALAITHLALKRDPNHPRFHYRKGLAAVKHNQFEKALAEFDHAIHKAMKLIRPFRGDAPEGGGDAKDAGHARMLGLPLLKSWMQRGEMNLHTGHGDAAYQDFSKALALDPNNTEALARRVEAALLSESFEKALPDLDALVEREGENLTLVLKRAEARFRAGRLHEALTDYDRVIAREPFQIPVYGKRAEARAAAGDLEGAIRDYSHVLEFKPGDFELLGKRGRLYWKQEQYPQAASDILKQLRKDPHSFLAVFEAAEASFQAGRAAEAESDFLRGLEMARQLVQSMNPDASGAPADEGLFQEGQGFLNALGLPFWRHYHRLGVLRAASGKPAEALHYLGIALNLCPENPARLLLDRGRIHAAASQPRKAAQDFNACLKLDPQCMEAYLAMGSLHEKEGNLDFAARDYNRAAKIQPRYGPVYTALGKIHLARNALEMALYHFRKAVDCDKGDAEALHALGRLLLTIPDEAERDLIRGMECVQSALQIKADPEWRAALAIGYSLNGNTDKACAVQKEIAAQTGSPEDQALAEHYAQGKTWAEWAMAAG